jgi:hypothetical protein
VTGNLLFSEPMLQLLIGAVANSVSEGFIVSVPPVTEQPVYSMIPVPVAELAALVSVPEPVKPVHWASGTTPDSEPFSFEGAAAVVPEGYSCWFGYRDFSGQFGVTVFFRHCFTEEDELVDRIELHRRLARVAGAPRFLPRSCQR